VEVVEREDPIPPLRQPAVGGEQLLTLVGAASGLDAVVDQDREQRVGYPAIVLEAVCLGFYA
jgi:hypothetical protein